jgi:hypothetical protein
LAEGLVRLSKFSFPFKLNATTRAFFSHAAELENPQTAADMRAFATGNPDLQALFAYPLAQFTTRSALSVIASVAPSASALDVQKFWQNHATSGER